MVKFHVVCPVHAISRGLTVSLNHVIDWDRAKVIDRESNRMDRWIREAIHIRKEQDKSMNRDEGSSYHLPHIYDYLLSAVSTPGGGQSF